MSLTLDARFQSPRLRRSGTSKFEMKLVTRRTSGSTHHRGGHGTGRGLGGGVAGRTGLQRGGVLLTRIRRGGRTRSRRRAD